MNTMIHDKQEVSFHVTVPGRYVPVAVHFSEVSTQAYLWQHKYSIICSLSYQANNLTTKPFSTFGSISFLSNLCRLGMENLSVDTRPKIPQEITIKEKLIIIVGEVFFMRAKHRIGDFEGFFEGAKTFLAPKLY
jgi:hypothetical protein